VQGEEEVAPRSELVVAQCRWRSKLVRTRVPSESLQQRVGKPRYVSRTPPNYTGDARAPLVGQDEITVEDNNSSASYFINRHLRPTNHTYVG
jgi:hypothetical protein